MNTESVSPALICSVHNQYTETEKEHLREQERIEKGENCVERT